MWCRWEPTKKRPHEDSSRGTKLVIGGPGGVGDPIYPQLVKNHECAKYAITSKSATDGSAIVLRCVDMQRAIDTYSRILFSHTNFVPSTHATWPRVYIEASDISFNVDNCSIRQSFIECCTEIFKQFDGDTLSRVEVKTPTANRSTNADNCPVAPTVASTVSDVVHHVADGNGQAAQRDDDPVRWYTS